MINPNLHLQSHQPVKYFLKLQIMLNLQVLLTIAAGF